MSKYNSWRCGGVAKTLYTPNTLTQLSDFLAHNTQEILLLGLGSNLLIGEQGFDGVVIHTKQLNNLTINNNNHTITAQAGVSLAKLSRFSGQHHYYGAEFFSTIPGSVGGALAMNAGCFGLETWQWVNSVQTIDTKGNQHTRTPADFKVGYRQVIPKFNDEFFISASFKFSKTCVNTNLNTDIKTLLKKRQDTQPTGLASCGSVFKNPQNSDNQKGNTKLYAGALIEQANLKGFCIGGACVSNKHANFIINTGNATPNDIKKLIKHIQNTIKLQFNIHLEPEVKII